MDFGPWNPGIQSQLPREILPFSTILDPGNIFQPFSEVEELGKFTGLAREDIVAFRPQRLAVHELLIRISANYAVSDGNQYQDLGFNFRNMAQTLLDKYIRPNMQEVVDCYEILREQCCWKIESELESTVFAPLPAISRKKTWWQKLSKSPVKPKQSIDPQIRESEILKNWQLQASKTGCEPLQQSVYFQLNRIVGSIMICHGRIRGEKKMLAALVTSQVCNSYGSHLIGELIEPMIGTGAKTEGYSRLPTQSNPVIMNVKGSSAAGKSTLRPLQHQLVCDLDLRWEDFALISPDIWRKFLLDYDSLGDGYKYAGTCSGHELKIVDQKLDAYMADKGKNNAVPHLIIDRFRFDSFTEKSGREGSNLLTRFGAKVYLYYMITPPDATVERAWKRGLQVGRYKAVDDLLDHNVEAFTGMPRIFFTWALDKEKDVHYEFLDNSVKLGERPRTVAFGSNGSLSILDADRLMDIDRFQKINVKAKSPEAVYPTGESMTAERNINFIVDCIKRLHHVEIVDFSNGGIAMRIHEGELLEWEPETLNRAVSDASIRAALLNIFSSSADRRVNEISAPDYIEYTHHHTLGQYGQ